MSAPHLHALIPDGLFVPTDADGPLAFAALPPPTPESIEAVTITPRAARGCARRLRVPSRSAATGTGSSLRNPECFSPVVSG
jgi:hypothetical protein